MAAAEGGMPDRRDVGLGSIGGGGGGGLILPGEWMGELLEAMGEGAALIDKPEMKRAIPGSRLLTFFKKNLVGYAMIRIRSRV